MVDLSARKEAAPVAVNEVDSPVGGSPQASALGEGGRRTMLEEHWAHLDDGSYRQLEYKALSKELDVTAKWLKRDHPTWRGAWSESQSRIKDAGIGSEVAQMVLAGFGAAYVAQARRTVIRFDNFAMEHAEQFVDGSAYPVTIEIIIWFVNFEQAKSRASIEARGKVFKGTVAAMLIKQLGYAAKCLARRSRRTCSRPPRR